MLKAHAKLRDYLKHKIEEADEVFGTGAVGLLRSQALVKNVDKITGIISSKKLFHKLNVLVNQEKLEKQKAVKVLNPSQTFNEERACDVWFESDTAMDLEQDSLNIWNKSTASNTI